MRQVSLILLVAASLALATLRLVLVLTLATLRLVLALAALRLVLVATLATHRVVLVLVLILKRYTWHFYIIYIDFIYIFFKP